MEMDSRIHYFEKAVIKSNADRHFSTRLYAENVMSEQSKLNAAIICIIILCQDTFMCIKKFYVNFLCNNELQKEKCGESCG